MNQLNEHIQETTAFAPATCANVIVGFDILGFAVDTLGDTVTLTRNKNTNTNQIVVKISDAREDIPLDVNKNTASFALMTLFDDLKIAGNFTLQLKKGIPLSSGLGGSAASAVAALVAGNAFLKEPLPFEKLAHYALSTEAAFSGRHADNIAPCLMGGLTLIRDLDPLEIIKLPPPQVFCVLVHPHLQIGTKEARQLLAEKIPLQGYIEQSRYLAGFMAALYQQDDDLLQRSLVDLLIEPQRAHLIPHFYSIKQSALEAGALGASFSGSGPTLFAFAKTKTIAEKVAHAMHQGFIAHGIQCDQWISPIATEGARLIGQSE